MRNITTYIALILVCVFSLSLGPDRGSSRHDIKVSRLKSPAENSADNKIPQFKLIYSTVSDSSTPGTPWFGGQGVTETVEQIMQREREHPYQYTSPREPRNENEYHRPQKLPNPDAPNSATWPPRDDNGLIEPQPNSPQTVGTNFLGITVSESGFIPPDNNGAAGPTQILVIANGRIKVFDKLGVLGGLNATTDNFFASVRSSGTSDCHVRYDRLSGRWFVVMIDVASVNRVLIAVSSGSSIINSSSFTFYQFQHDLVGPTPNSDTGGFADYPTLGVDANALYIGVNIFNPGFTGCTGFVVRKSALLASSLVVTAFRQLCTGSTTGPYTPQGVDNDDALSTEGYFIGVDALVFSELDIRRVSTPGGTPSISGNILITVPTTYFPLNVPHSGMTAGRLLDALDDRLFAAHINKNQVTGTSSLWTAHNIAVNLSGVGGSSGDRTAGRWYEIRNMTTTPTLYQSGTLFDNAASNFRYFWIPSVAMSGQGHMAMGCSSAGTIYFAEIRVAGRLYSDALGTTQAPTLDQASSTAYNIQAANPQRWGDYSQVVVDPNDDMTMWTFQEYCNASNSWGERVTQLIAPPPATPSSATSVPPGSPSTNSTVTGTVVSGSGFYDPGSDPGGPGYTNRISASVSGGVVVNSITFNTPTQVTLNLNTTAAPTGFKDVTITNPDGQSRTGSGILFVDPALPVIIASFTGSVSGGNNVLLKWVTANELNNSGFEVQRLSSGSSAWNNLDFIRGYGTTQEPKTYTYLDKKLNTGSYSYRLKQVDYNGNHEYFDLTDKVIVGIPQQFTVSQNYPNPSNPVSKIDYSLPVDAKVILKVYDLTGREVAVIVNDFKQAGYYTAVFDGSNLASGIYIYKLQAADYTATKKLVLIK